MKKTYRIVTEQGRIADGSLPFLTQEELTNFDTVGYTGTLGGNTMTYESYLNRIHKGIFTIEQTKYADNGDQREVFSITREFDPTIGDLQPTSLEGLTKNVVERALKKLSTESVEPFSIDGMTILDIKDMIHNNHNIISSVKILLESILFNYEEQYGESLEMYRNDYFKLTSDQAKKLFEKNYTVNLFLENPDSYRTIEDPKDFKRYHDCIFGIHMSWGKDSVKRILKNG